MEHSTNLTLNEDDHYYLLQKSSEILEHFHLLDDIDIDLLADIVDYFTEFIVASLNTFVAWKTRYHHLVDRTDNVYRTQ